MTDRARQAAWECYIDRVNVMLTQQRREFAAGRPQGTTTLIPPTDVQVAAIERAMRDAQREIVSLALGPIVEACDAIDNSHSKSPVVKEIRASLEKVYHELHALKANGAPPAPDSSSSTPQEDGR